jgi:RNA recognition motif-containing protein
MDSKVSFSRIAMNGIHCAQWLYCSKNGYSSTMTETRRIHISGLGGQFSRDELEQRLSSYGEVIDFDGCEAHHVDAVGTSRLTGNPRKYAFATLRTTPAALAKCMNTLSGVLWKGARLRVSEARPKWDVR